MFILLLILLSIGLIILATTVLKLHPFLALLAASFFFGICSGIPMEELIETINAGFGKTIGNIGIVIIVGIIIGTFLEKTGGAYTLANVVLRLVGSNRVHTAMGAIGYLVSIPVFADSGFIILSSLNKALAKKAGVSLAGTAIALSLGLMASHTMVPPTPGPIAAAGIIDADLGKVILIGLFVSIGATLVVLQFANWMGKRIYIDPEPDLSESEIMEKTAKAPSAIKSFLPILVPILLIILRSIAKYPTEPFGTGGLADTLIFLGNPVFALIVGLFFAFLLPKKLDRSMLSSSGWVGESLKAASLIILITGAGGAFGSVLQHTDLKSVIDDLGIGNGLGLWLPFIISAIIKSAQGSSTVAIITTAGIVQAMLGPMGLDAEMSKAMVVVAIGAGAGVVSHANDSFFWVVTQMSNMSVNQGYRLHSLGSGILGISAMIILSVISLFL
ncbi:MAG: GntP family permease [Bacteroidia bacterium]|nr:GntP family permease [Bacteroidia bacterium]